MPRPTICILCRAGKAPIESGVRRGIAVTFFSCDGVLNLLRVLLLWRETHQVESALAIGEHAVRPMVWLLPQWCP